MTPAFTLRELFAVIMILGTLLALGTSGIQGSRELSRRYDCHDNLRRIAIAFQEYHSTFGCFPANVVGLNASVLNHSAYRDLLPYLEEPGIYRQLGTIGRWDLQSVMDDLQVSVFSCPSDPQACRTWDRDAVKMQSTNYGLNFGSLFAFGPKEGAGWGNGAFCPNKYLTFADFCDGTSNTLFLAEVKVWQPYVSKEPPELSDNVYSHQDIQRVIRSATRFTLGGHSNWGSGMVHQTGVTSVLGPNTTLALLRNGEAVDVDYIPSEEKNWETGRVTRAIITSRSFHPGIVTVAKADGSTQTVHDGIQPIVWQAVSTRGGVEIAELE